MGNLQYKPNGERCIVKRAEHKKQTESGLFLPDIATNRKLNEGTIEAVGTKCDEHLKEGQFIIFSPFAGQDIKIGDEEYLVIPQEDIVVYKEEG